MPYLIIIFLVLIMVFMVFMRQPVFGSPAKGNRLKRIKSSPNYMNNQFQNLSITPSVAEDTTMFRVMTDFFIKKKDPNLKPLQEIPFVKTDLLSLDKKEEIFIWFGHSSYFLQTHEVRFLIDPVFSEYGSPLPIFNKSFKGSNIYQAENFPKLDYLIITHDHYDHLDYPTIKKLKNKINKIIVPLGVGAHFEKWGFREEDIIEGDWYDVFHLKNDISITFTPARHFSGRKFKRNQTLWTSYVLKTPHLNLFLGGDSGYDFHFKEIGEKYGPFDFAILENGQYNNAWKYIHMLPDEVVKASIDLQAKNIVPVHSGKFALALHPWDEPLELVVKNSYQKPYQVVTPKIGQVVFFNSKQFPSTKWWKNK